MSIDVGIIGLAQSGKTTVFNTLTRGSAATTGHAPEGMTPHVGVAKVSEPRLPQLAGLFPDKKLVPAEVRYTDIGASVKSLVADKGIGGELLNRLSAADALINVVRVFTDPTVPHPSGSPDAARDIGTMNLELAFSDLAILERKLERLDVSLKAAKANERPAFLHEESLLKKLGEALQKETPLRDLPLSAEETRHITGYQFLTAKPLLILLNIDEDQLPREDALTAELGAAVNGERCRLINLCGKLEMELSQLEEGAAAEFRKDYGITESGLDRVIRASYELLGLVSFFTVGSNEIRAWSIPRDTPAVKAAGKIHSDMERGFIRAEVIRHEELLACGGLAEARKRGLLRLEGRDYAVQDGDVINFLFNV
ncbi:MAG: redox-regulated ATPase YchF [Chloroflexota bacterium]